jgi:hypothetical protein
MSSFDQISSDFVFVVTRRLNLTKQLSNGSFYKVSVAEYDENAWRAARPEVSFPKPGTFGM